MTRAVVVLRPEPGNAATAARVEAAGLAAVRMPIFATRALAWTLPGLAATDALLVTSANAPRLAGAQLAGLAHLPVVAVGARTAQACRDAGLGVAIVGESDAADAIAAAARAGLVRLLHLAGADRTAGTAALPAVIVYESVQVADAEVPAGATVLLHSTRAAHALAAARVERGRVDLVAISDAVLAGAGVGWRARRVAAYPGDAAMIAACLIDAADCPPIDLAAPDRG